MLTLGEVVRCGMTDIIDVVSGVYFEQKGS